MYDNGEGGPVDDRAAAKYYGLAADQGHEGSMYNLAIMNDEGEGMPENNNEAIRLYTMAAQTGHGNSMYNMGVMYRDGDGVAVDAAKSYYWYALAAKLDVEKAAGERDRAALRLSAAQKTKLDNDANKFATAYFPAN